MDKILIYHAPKESRIRSTIVGKFNSQTGEICIASARCGKHDKFCKKTGRTIAAGRLEKGKCIASATVQKEETIHGAFLAVARPTAEWLVKNSLPVARPAAF